MPVRRKAGIVEAALWMVGLSFILGCCLPVIGPLLGGLVGGYKAADIGNAIAAAMLPALVVGAGVLLAVTFATVPVAIGPLAGLIGGFGAFGMVLINCAPIFVGAIIGAILAQS